MIINREKSRTETYLKAKFMNISLKMTQSNMIRKAKFKQCKGKTYSISIEANPTKSE